MLAILPDGRALPARRLDALDPALGGFGDRDAFARRSVPTSVYVDRHGRRVFVGVLFRLKAFDVLVAVRISVIDDPS